MKVADDVRKMLFPLGSRDRPDLPRVKIPTRQGKMLSHILHPAALPLAELTEVAVTDVDKLVQKKRAQNCEGRG